MSFQHKSTVIYAVWSLDVWGDEEEWTVNDRRRAGSISVHTDRQNKSGSWDVSNAALTRALVKGSYLRSGTRSRELDIDGEDDGIIFVGDAMTGEPVFQLEYERHHHIDEPSKGLFSESKENPISSLSTGETAALVAAGVVLFGGIGYWLYSRSQAASQAALPVVQTPVPGLTAQQQADAADQVPPFVPGDYGSGGGPGGVVPSVPAGG
jgi:hypothetical protein